MIKTGDEFAHVIEHVDESWDKVGEIRDRVDALELHIPSKNNRETLAAMVAARSNLWLALDALVAAQESQATRDVDDHIIELVKNGELESGIS